MSVAAPAARSMRMACAAPAAEPGSYNITVSVSGVAQDGSAVGGSLQLAVPVTQPEWFEITALEADTAI